MTDLDLDELERAASVVGFTCDRVTALALIARCRAAEAEAVRLTTKTYCAYCGESFALDDEAATVVDGHIRICPKHPMRAAEAERDEARRIAVAFAERYASQPGDWTDEDEAHEVGDLGLLYHGKLRAWADGGGDG